MPYFSTMAAPKKMKAKASPRERTTPSRETAPVR
jgi:hypothetical protein